MNYRARFWKYTGNHSQGFNCGRLDSHGLGLDLIAYLEYCSRSGDYQVPLDSLDLERVKTIQHGAKSSFGHEVTVIAPKEIWDKAKTALEYINAT